MRITLIFTNTVLYFLFLISPVQAVVLYKIRDVGSLGGSWTDPKCINNSGQVAGTAEVNVSNPDHAFRTAANQPINPLTDDFGAFGGTISYAWGINDSGQVVGNAAGVGNGSGHAFRNAGGPPLNPATDDLGTLGGVNSGAYGINNSGQAVGVADTSYNRQHAFRTAANQRINPSTDDLGTLGGTSSCAYGINDLGQVVGEASTTTGAIHAFRTAPNQPIDPSGDLGTFGGANSRAYDVNNSGQVIGFANLSNGSEHAFRTSPNQPLNNTTDDLGTLLNGTKSWAYSVNNSGQVVGFSTTSGTYGYHAFVYNGNGPMQDLNDLIDPASGWALQIANGINDLGQIVGIGINAVGQTRGFVLTPVPEPSTLALLGIGSISLIILARWQKQANRLMAIIVAISVTCIGNARADVFNMGGTRNADGTWMGIASLETVPVGNINNTVDSTTGFGSVDHAYNIGKYEVTAGQYTEFLNTVAQTDTYGLYNMDMVASTYGCQIQRTGTSGSYTYSVAEDFANRPVNFVSFWDAVRFTNWLHNGQGNGDTETGAYTLSGYNGSDGHTIVKNSDSQWWIPSENEWYKAAYHKNDGLTGNYFHYPTSSDVIPSNVLETSIDPGNTATFYNNGYTIDSPYYRTEVGSHENSSSPYGTFDQGGNVMEWNDSILFSSFRKLRGGAFTYSIYDELASSFRRGFSPTFEGTYIGFRVASVPEPGSLAMILSIAVGGLLWWRRKR